MNWNEEIENMGKGKKFLKLTAGQHRVCFLNDGEEMEKPKYQKPEETIKVIRFTVTKGEEEFTWEVTKGTTLNSLYGQIALIARQNGSLADRTVTVIVKGSGKETSYTILEALTLMEQEEKNRKEVKVEKIVG